MAEIVGTPSLQKVLAIGANANSVDITGLPTPATSSSATSKNYVDTAVATKEGTITAGTTAQYFRGDKTFVTLNTTIVPEGTNLYYTDVRADARITAQKGAASGICPLDSSSKIASTYLPAIAITDTYVVVSQAAMLALTAQTGDVAVRTDINKSFILQGTDPATLADWQELLTPTDAVLSVNGLTGSVTLTTTNIGEGTNLYYTAARFNTAFSGKSTSDLTEGSNLYYTTARFDTALATKTTTNLAEGTNLYFTNARAIASTLTGYTSGAGTISSSDTILQAIQKLNANDGLKANIASPTFTGTVTIPTPFTLGAVSVTTTGTQLNYLNTATGVIGTGSVVLNVDATLGGVTKTLGTSSTVVADVIGALRTGSLVISSPYVADGFSPAYYFTSTTDNPTLPKSGIFTKTTGGGSYLFLGTSTSYAAGITNTVSISPDSLIGSQGINFVGTRTFASASGDAYMYHTTALGLVIYGNGTTDDFTLAGATGANILSVATGTTTARFFGAVNIGGTFTRRAQSGVTSQFQIEGTSFDSSSMSLFVNESSNATTSPCLFLSRSRGSAVGSNTIVQSGDRVGLILFEGTDGTIPQPLALIQANVDGTPGTNDMPGRLEFYTSADGSVSPTLRLTIGSTGTATFTGQVFTVASTTSLASLNIPHGTAPISPVNGDIWTTTTSMYARINGATVSLGGGFSWNTTAAGTSGTGLALTVSNSASSSTIGQSITVGNTQTQVVTGFQIDVGTAAVAHIGQLINAKGASTTQRGLKIDMGSTGTGVPIEIRSDANIGGASLGGIHFSTSLSATGTGTGLYFATVASGSATGYGLYFNNVCNSTTGGTAYGVYMSNISGNTSTGIGWHVANLTYNGLAGATSAKYFSLNQALTAAITGARTADTAEILHSRTNTSTSGTVADSFNIMYLKRTSVQNGSGGTFTQAGAVLKLENVATQTAGTLTDTTFVLSLAQGALTTTNFKRVIDCAGVTIWKSDGTSPNGTLTGTAGDICLNGTSGKIYYCTGTTVWL